VLRLKELDILRGFAALNVVLYHYTSRFRDIYVHNYDAKYDWIYGHYGVQLFFVISGFVIFMTLQKVKNVKEFAFKRFLRLFPTYWICLITTLIISYLLHYNVASEYTFFRILMNFTMIQGVFEINNIDGAYWSLLPELFFYVFMAFMYSIGWLTKVRTIAIIWLSLMILNQLSLLPFGAYFLNLQYGMFFLAGILFYEIKFNKGTFINHLLIAGCLITAIWVDQRPGSIYVFTGIFALFYLFIYDKLKTVSFSPLLFLGYISYPLYLLHQNIGFSLMNLLKLYIPNEFVVILISILILTGMAWIVTKYLEKPLLTYLKSKSYQKALVFKEQGNKEFSKQEVIALNEQ
jgi:peptidoglycan/LPS O-acetylase OafA/YrhL